MEFIHDGHQIPSAPNTDPNSVVDYGCDWADHLPEGDTISASQWIAPDGVTITNEIVSGMITAFTISNVPANTRHLITNRVTTAQGRVLDRSMYIACHEL